MLAPPAPRPPISLDKAICWDIETLINCFTLNFQALYSDLEATFEISQYRDDRQLLFEWIDYWGSNHIPMIGFNSVSFDYPVLHFIYENPTCSVWDIYQKAQDIITGGDRFGNLVWESNRYVPQIDLFKIHHFDNRAKSTSLKALEVNMRSHLVLDMPLPFDKPVSREQIDTLLIPYNRHDVAETKRFALFSLDAIKFRIALSTTLRGDVMNFSDTKIGGKILEARLGAELCYDEDRRPRRTFRTSIALADIILPWIKFTHPEFQRIFAWMQAQTLTAAQLDIEANEATKIQTKGVFTGVKAHVGGLEFGFGTGGVHASVSSEIFTASDDWWIVDIDVAALYPSIAIENGFYPEHLGDRFVEEYTKLPIERNKHEKGTVANALLKLASNGTYGNSNNPFSVFYDPKFTMSITINGQLMLCMLAERLLSVETLQIIAVNTDGIAYTVHSHFAEHAVILRRQWERMTRLKLEEVRYSRMWVRDCNSYVAEALKGKLKLKGAYWYPVKFPEDIANASPACWHKDYSAQIAIMAAVAHMTRGADISQFIQMHADPFDFMLRTKVNRGSLLMIGDRQVQRTCRYFMSVNGEQMRKLSPAAGPEGTFKRRNGISDYEWATVLASLPPDTHDPRIHTKNRSRYTTRETVIQVGYRVTECNRASDFDFSALDFQYYIDQARKLVIGV